MASTSLVSLRMGHSPDPDDAFMWWPLVPNHTGRTPLDTGRFTFETIARDIEELNELSESAALEITAMSCAQYPRVCDRYVLTACGASMGDGYGPKIIARRELDLQQLAAGDVRIAIPGTRTSAWTALQLMLGPSAIRAEAVPFDAIISRVAAGEFDAGLVIHEGQITYESAGLRLVADLGQWWKARTGLPLPLGVNAVRRDLDEIHGSGTIRALAGLLRRSVEFAMANRTQALEYALQFGRDLDQSLAGRFVDMYVNKWTLQFGRLGEQAITRFLTEAAQAGILPEVRSLDVVGAADSDTVRERAIGNRQWGEGQ